LDGLGFDVSVNPVSNNCGGVSRRQYVSKGQASAGWQTLFNQFKTHPTNPWASETIGPISYWFDYNCTSGGWTLWWGDYNNAKVRLPIWFGDNNGTGNVGAASPDQVPTATWVQMDWVSQITANAWWWDSHLGDYDSTNYYVIERFGFPFTGGVSDWQFQDVHTMRNSYLISDFGATDGVFQVLSGGKDGKKENKDPPVDPKAGVAAPAADAKKGTSPGVKVGAAVGVIGGAGVAAAGAFALRSRRKARRSVVKHGGSQSTPSAPVQQSTHIAV